MPNNNPHEIGTNNSENFTKSIGKMSMIEPNYFKMRLPGEFPLWKRVMWRLFGTKDCGVSDGWYVEGYWFMGICLITKNQ